MIFIIVNVLKWIAISSYRVTCSMGLLCLLEIFIILHLDVLNCIKNFDMKVAVNVCLELPVDIC